MADKKILKRGFDTDYNLIVNKLLSLLEQWFLLITNKTKSTNRVTILAQKKKKRRTPKEVAKCNAHLPGSWASHKILLYHNSTKKTTPYTL